MLTFDIEFIRTCAERETFPDPDPEQSQRQEVWKTVPIQFGLKHVSFVEIPAFQVQPGKDGDILRSIAHSLVITAS